MTSQRLQGLPEKMAKWSFDFGPVRPKANCDQEGSHHRTKQTVGVEKKEVL